ncbi:uncharacterized protein [Oryza sativa Japonica Group]|uniref:Os08g0549900 protein n=2 Tax=Oryza TaxID=4527 RepID=A0A8I3B0X6_ORYSJ|nr:uncharacterized protein LOC4346250 [Oryza sativa Japonica Group]KAB8109490.1 hypothetical protein EE612_045788 [Oryza sativa]EAZ43574.1 hypothetical protein OsJ_28196 [Oryza sativa Japonica Group]KAF2920828.1 hypothetical protein DAI22_08g241200 [Oryza sativa Japonica Group]BAD08957.1 unknown protein [Oryza sativa Japonica Group]BAF24356.2 Os08g0549900 [Oryza sativa Japonica Group]|eukprot:NP_001062442.2 Os08g0549900 [Oryza sativa Japonica Group]
MEVEEMKPAGAGGTTVGDGFFTEADLAAADQLVQLSVSGGGCEDDGYDSSSSTTLQSVNNAEASAAMDDDDDMGLDRRVRKRYRHLSELYAATLPVKENHGGGKRKKREEDMGKKKQPQPQPQPQPR